MGESWDGWMFDCMVFASMDDAFVANFQMHERQRNIKNLKDIEIFYLIGGRYDKKYWIHLILGRISIHTLWLHNLPLCDSIILWK